MKLWDSAAYALFKLTASGVREVWERGNDEPSAQTEILAQLNQRLRVPIECLATIGVWSFGQREKTFRMEINVNNVDPVDE